jgi:CelD/BcsL family acetyltransferase involved in cellulose biosynthesis
VRVEPASEIDRGEWNALVEADPGATFFARAEWVELISEATGGRPLYLLARDGGALAAGLPAVERSRLGFSVLESLPHGTYGGVVSIPDAPPEAARALLDRYRRIALRPSVAAAHLMDLKGTGGALRGFRVRDEGAQIVRLDRPYEEVWNGFRPSARNKVRKARKAGVAVRRGSTEADFAAYHAMLVESSARWGRPCAFGASFFAGLSRVPGDAVQLWLAEIGGEIIGGDLNFVQHGWIMNWGNVSRTDAQRHAPNNLLHAAAIERGIEDGHRVYDLGSSAGIEGVAAFKAAFGTERIPLRLLSAEKPWYRALRRLAGTLKRGRRP